MSPLTDAESFEFHPSQQPDGRIQRQDHNLQCKLNTDLSGPAAVVLCPQCLQWIFVYSQISVRPLNPPQTEIRVPLPSHSVSQVPLSQSQTTPRHTCRSWTLEKRPYLHPKFDELPFPFHQKQQKHSKWRTVIILSSPLSCVQVLTHTEHSSLLNASWRIIV